MVPALVIVRIRVCILNLNVVFVLFVKSYLSLCSYVPIVDAIPVLMIILTTRQVRLFYCSASMHVLILIFCKAAELPPKWFVLLLFCSARIAMLVLTCNN